MIYLTKQEGLYQNKVNSSLISTCNGKMDSNSLLQINTSLIKSLKPIKYMNKLTCVQFVVL